MAETKKVYRLNKKNGVTYIYMDTPYWDKEKKASRHKSECIGKLAEDGVTEIYNKKYKAQLEEEENPVLVSSTEFIGEKLIIEKIIEKTGLRDQLIKVFTPENVEKYIALASYYLATREPLSYAQNWLDMRGYNVDVTDEQVSELLHKTCDDLVNTFFKEWINYNATKKNALFDITSTASYDMNNEYVERGYYRDKENLKDINIGLLTTYEDTIPLCYKILSRSITEESLLEQVSECLKEYGAIDYSFVGDENFYSDKNLKDLNNNKYQFIIPVSQDTDWVNEEIAKVLPMIRFEGDVIQESSDANIVYGFTKEVFHKDYGHVWLHIYFDATRKEFELGNFNIRLRTLKQKYEIPNGVKDSKDIEFCHKYFEIEETNGKRIVKPNLKAIQEFQDSYSSTWTIVTNTEVNAVNALRYYRLRNEIELHFDDLKNTLDCRRLRTFKESTMKGKIFIYFLSLILINKINNEVAKMDFMIDDLSWKEILNICSSYSITHFTGNHKDAYSVPTELQRNIFKYFDIEIPYKGRQSE